MTFRKVSTLSVLFLFVMVTHVEAILLEYFEGVSAKTQYLSLFIV